MNVQHSGDETGGKFFLQDDGQHIGEISYYLSDKGRFVIQHTEVLSEKARV